MGGEPSPFAARRSQTRLRVPPLGQHHALETETSLYLALTYAGGGDLSLWFGSLNPSRR